MSGLIFQVYISLCQVWYSRYISLCQVWYSRYISILVYVRSDIPGILVYVRSDIPGILVYARSDIPGILVYVRSDILDILVYVRSDIPGILVYVRSDIPGILVYVRSDIPGILVYVRSHIPGILVYVRSDIPGILVYVRSHIPGILVYVRSDIPGILDHVFPEDIEGLFIEINLRKSNWLLFGTYHPQSQDDAYYFNSVGRAKNMTQKYDKIILAGDFNAEENEMVFLIYMTWKIWLKTKLVSNPLKIRPVSISFWKTVADPFRIQRLFQPAVHIFIKWCLPFSYKTFDQNINNNYGTNW